MGICPRKKTLYITFAMIVLVAAGLITNLGPRRIYSKVYRLSIGLVEPIKTTAYWKIKNWLRGTTSINRLKPSFAELTEGPAVHKPASILALSVINGPLHVNPSDPNYFSDNRGKAIHLTGAHTWANFQDSGSGYPPPAFNFLEYLDFLNSNNYNFFRLWAWEQSRWSLDTANNDFWYAPLPYLRSGYETRLDGQPKFDLNQFNQEYFDRMRLRVIQAYYSYLPLTMNGEILPLASKSFLETFSGMPSAPQPFQSTHWDVTVHSRDFSQAESLTPMNAEHGSQCEPPPAVHVVTTYEDSVYICHDHVMTALNAPDYGVMYLTPDQQIDFSAGETILSFDLSTKRNSNRDWVDIWITPYLENLQLPLEDWLPDLNGPPRHAIHLKMDMYNDQTVFVGESYDNFVVTSLPRKIYTGYEQYLTPSATRRDKFELRISKTHIKFGMPDYNLWWVDTDFQEPGWSRGVVQLGHHSYNPEKDCNFNGTCGANTWHWDNLYISDAVPFSILQADKRFSDAVTGDVIHFSAPAPANAFLRFVGIGNSLAISLDNGKTWIPCQQQLQMKSVTEHYASYFMPIPEGVTQIRVNGQDWWGGAWNIRDISIWSLTQ